MEFDVEHKPGKDVTAGTRVARKRRLGIFTLLRALGYDEENAPGFLDRFVAHFDFLEGQWDKERDVAPTQDEALVEIYKRARPGEPPTVESAKAYFRNAFFESRRYDLSRVGRYKLNRKLGEEVAQLGEPFGLTGAVNAEGEPLLDLPDEDQNVLSRCEVLAAVTYMLHLVKQEPGYRLDDQDHFANRRIRSVGELIQNQVRIGLSRMERVVRERMTTQDVEAITPQTLINIRPVVAAIKEFFGTSQLSQFMDQVNPLSGLTHRRRLSALGPGGLVRERAGFEVRDVHFSHYGRMCPIETPGGPEHRPDRGLSVYARSTSSGSSSRRTARSRTARSPARSSTWRPTRRRTTSSPRRTRRSSADGALADERVLVRRSPQAASLEDLRKMLEAESFFGATTDIGYVPPTEVDFIDVSPKQIVSVGTATDPVPRARRRQPRADGRQHAAPGGAAPAGRGAVHRHRHRRPRRPRRRRPRPGDRRRRGRRGVRRLDHRAVQERRQEGLPPRQVPPVEPGHVHQPEAARQRGRPLQEGHDPGRRPVDRPGRARARQEPARRVHAVGGLQLRGRDHPVRAAGEGRRAHVDPHQGARGRRPRHQARARRDLPRHPEPVRRHPRRPRRSRDHPRRRRGRARRRPRRQGHAEGRDRADPRGAPAARHLRREGPRGPRHEPQGAARRGRQGHRRQGVQP